MGAGLAVLAATGRAGSGITPGDMGILGTDVGSTAGVRGVGPVLASTVAENVGLTFVISVAALGPHPEAAATAMVIAMVPNTLRQAITGDLRVRV